MLGHTDSSSSAYLIHYPRVLAGRRTCQLTATGPPTCFTWRREEFGEARLSGNLHVRKQLAYSMM